MKYEPEGVIDSEVPSETEARADWSGKSMHASMMAC